MKIITKILVVNNIEANQEQLEILINKVLDDSPEGDVILARSIDEAIGLARLLPHPDIAIVNQDYTWEDIDNTLAKLCTLKQSSPVVILTGNPALSVVLSKVVVVMSRAEAFLNPPTFLLNIVKAWVSWPKRLEAIAAEIRRSEEIYETNIAAEPTSTSGQRVLGHVPA